MDCKMTKEEKMALLKLPKQCLEPMDYGQNCDELTPKWYFDTQTKVCYSFEYSGCGPEFSNRFESKEDCNSMCVENYKYNNESLGQIKTSTAPINIEPEEGWWKMNFILRNFLNQIIFFKDICGLPMAKGNCSLKQTKWYYDPKSKFCKQFEFTGCNGNENRFETREQCTEICEINKRREICNSNKAQGPCYQFQTRWYLDTETRSCKEFQYGGKLEFNLWVYIKNIF